MAILHRAAPAGAVLEFRTQLAKATLLPESRTPLMRLSNQFLFYVVSGEGRLDDGVKSWDLRNGITMLIPPDVHAASSIRRRTARDGHGGVARQRASRGRTFWCGT